MLSLFFNALQIFDESLGPPKTDEDNLGDESKWIYKQIASGMVPLFAVRGGRDLSINKADIARFLELQHVQKLDVSIVDRL